MKKQVRCKKCQAIIPIIFKEYRGLTPNGFNHYVFQGTCRTQECKQVMIRHKYTKEN